MQNKSNVQYVKFVQGVKDAWETLLQTPEKIDFGTLYFIYDSPEADHGKLYLGTKLIGGDIDFELPTKVEDLKDVYIDEETLAHMHLLTYNAETQSWQNASLADISRDYSPDARDMHLDVKEFETNQEGFVELKGYGSAAEGTYPLKTAAGLIWQPKPRLKKQIIESEVALQALTADNQADEDTIYLVEADNGKYNEYIILNINNQQVPELLGSVDITEFSETVAQLQTDIGEIGIYASQKRQTDPMIKPDLILSTSGIDPDLEKSLTVDSNHIRLINGKLKILSPDYLAEYSQASGVVHFNVQDINSNDNSGFNINFQGDGERISTEVRDDDDGLIIRHNLPGTSHPEGQLTVDKIVQPNKKYYDSADCINILQLTPGSLITGNVYEQINAYGDNDDSLPETRMLRIPKITKDDQGHIASISDVGVYLPDDVSVSAIGINANDTSRLEITATNGQKILSGTNSLYNTIMIDGQYKIIKNQEDLGNFYSASKVENLIDSKFNGINALVFKGTVGKLTSTVYLLPQVNVAIGDTYVVDTGVYSTSGFEDVFPGDLFIASGDEYRLTSDAVINYNKVYYIKNYNTYTRVLNPVAEDLDEYYEATGIIQTGLTWNYIKSGNEQKWEEF